VAVYHISIVPEGAFATKADLLKDGAPKRLFVPALVIAALIELYSFQGAPRRFSWGRL
jgi:hypothetical protein